MTSHRAVTNGVLLTDQALSTVPGAECSGGKVVRVGQDPGGGLPKIIPLFYPEEGMTPS